ncbi:hypothetical protein HPB47_022447 [Ixodes persulcatus]|uniref:Uncharacterized protein n=1 Tax=Ixodes persulcatus TaxID=34615 RepID=A0AC60QAE2_IXOPE|nr:hypothetical protein HPB47_022447 [Ixodes persulcatus]
MEVVPSSRDPYASLAAWPLEIRTSWSSRTGLVSKVSHRSVREDEGWGGVVGMGTSCFEVVRNVLITNYGLWLTFLYPVFHLSGELVSKFVALQPRVSRRPYQLNFPFRVFELLVYYCSTFMEMIPLSFMLGFYVTFTATRWWNQYMAIPWPDRLMNVLMMYVPGQDDGSRMLRRTLMRYLNLSLILVLRSISKAVKRRFPTKDHLIEAGFMTKLEVELWQSIPSTEFNTFWVPCTWFINLLREARNECRITDAQGVKLILEEFNDFRAKCGLLWSYDWISIPLVYTQVVTMATYSFFGAAVFGRQYIHSPDPIIDSRHHFDFYVPVFTVIQYFLYMGLLKVRTRLDAVGLRNVNCQAEVSYLGVDTLDGPPPPLVKDSYFHKMDYQLPYTAASVSYKKKTYRGSVAYMHVPQKERSMVVPEMSEEDDEDSPRNGGSGGEDDDGRHGLSKRSSSSLWTLMHRRSSSPQNDNVESGLAQDSKLHVYFKGSSPSGSQEDSEDANGLSEGSQQ